MNADGLHLPKGVTRAQVVDGMREVLAYDITRNRCLIRWDTVIAGKQYTIGGGEILGLQEEILAGRAKAKEAFEKIEREIKNAAGHAGH